MSELTSCLYNKAKQRGVKFAKDNHFELDETKYFLFNRNQFVTDFENTIIELNSNVKLEDIPKKKRKQIEIKYWKWIFKTATEFLEKPLREQEIGWYGYYFDLDDETDKLFVKIECTMFYE